MRLRATISIENSHQRWYTVVAFEIGEMLDKNRTTGITNWLLIIKKMVRSNARDSREEIEEVETTRGLFSNGVKIKRYAGPNHGDKGSYMPFVVV